MNVGVAFSKLIGALLSREEVHFSVPLRTPAAAG